MKRSIHLLLTVGVLLGACSLPGVEGPAAPPAIVQLPYRLNLEMTSKIPDPYYVLAGPSESYRRYPFNAWAEKALRQSLAASSGSPSQPQVTVEVQLDQLRTGYFEIGGGPTRSAPIYAGLAGRGLLSGDDMDDDGRAIPSEIHKSIQLTGALEIRKEGQLLTRRDLTVAEEEVVLWTDFDAWSYDYGNLLKAVIDKLNRQIDAELVKVLAAGGAGS